MGQYTQVDLIGLAGANPTLYGYMQNPLVQVDIFGLVPLDELGYFVYGLFKRGCHTTNYLLVLQQPRVTLPHKVVKFKMKFYPKDWARYEEAVVGTIKLLPDKSRWDNLKKII